MALSRTELKKEIVEAKKSIAQLQETIKRCEDGILVQEIVLNAFEEKLQ